MTIYAVLAPPAKGDSDEAEPDRFVFVKEGFCWPASYMTILWLIWRRLWLALLIYVVVLAAVLAVVGLVPAAVGWVILVLFAILVGLEANNLRRWTLERRGYRFVGIAVGDRLSEAEYRFFASWSEAAKSSDRASPSTPSTPKTPAPRTPARFEAGDIIGMFPTAGARP